MLLKVLFLLIILYFVLRTVSSMIRAIRHDGGRSPRRDLHREAERPHVSRSPENGRRHAVENVEDAKWVDL